MKLLEAKSSDLNSILALFEHSIRGSCTSDYNQEQIDAWCSSAQNTERWLSKIRDQYFIKALLGDQLAGIASFENPNYLDVMYVSPMFQRSGIAAGLYNEIEQYAINHGTGKLYSDVSHTAKPFFESRGFIALHENHLTINGIDLSNWRMRKSL